jgi:hypothetical protein
MLLPVTTLLLEGSLRVSCSALLRGFMRGRSVFDAQQPANLFWDGKGRPSTRPTARSAIP